MTNREVTEQDFRMPEYRDAKPEDYEFRADGKLVRKDRWERGIRSIVGILGMSRDDFEVDDVINHVKVLIESDSIGAGRLNNAKIALKRIKKILDDNCLDALRGDNQKDSCIKEIYTISDLASK